MDYAEFREPDRSVPQRTTAQIRSRGLHPTSKASVGAGWLVLPRVRFHEPLAGPSHETQGPARWGPNKQLDYSLCQLSREMPRTAPIGSSVSLGAWQPERYGQEVQKMPVEIIGELGTSERRGLRRSCTRRLGRAIREHGRSEEGRGREGGVLPGRDKEAFLQHTQIGLVSMLQKRCDLPCTNAGALVRGCLITPLASRSQHE